MIRRLAVGILGFLLAHSVFSQITYNSANNQQSDWHAISTWTFLPASETWAPATPGNPTNSNCNAININGYVRVESGGLTINNANPVLTVYDTLYIVGNVTLGSGASMSVQPAGVLIIVGNLTLAGSFNMTNGGNVVVTGNLSVTNGSINNTSDHLYVFGTTSASGGGTIDGCNPYGGCTPGSQVQTEAQLNSQNPSLSDFVNNGGALPVQLLFFKVETNDFLTFSWATASELNFHYFNLQRSWDGLKFETMAVIHGQGTSTDRHDYIYIEQNPPTGTSYYRLQSVDYDLFTENFSILKVDHLKRKSFSINPNPFTGEMFFIQLNFLPKENERVVVYDAMGNERVRIQATDLQREYRLPNKLEAGIYFAKYISPDFTEVFRVIVN